MTQRIRCAIYTRKSSEEGLEQSFNSLDAQREACEAYIKSQQHEGWRAIAAHYDDGGFSGGNMDRPAFKQMMTEIQAGKVNVVVVYKVDRLTRSLADFAKMIEQFDKFGVSFVSVTQQFNTTSSMGRLTLNVLLSFAQFEREVTGERIRDKIAASKKRGMWMGGTVPIGYSAKDRKLVINESEAVNVKTIFNEFLRLGNVNRLKDWLRENNIRSRGGNHFFRGPLYLMLRNSHYIGLIKHRKETYQGEHPAIIDRDTWDKVQEMLDGNIQGKVRKPRASKVSLFTGRLFDAEGTLYTPTHAAKNGRRYRYYTSQAVIRKTQTLSVPTRIPAPDLENAVVGCVLDLLRSATRLVALFEDATQPGSNLSLPNGALQQIVESAGKLADRWESTDSESRVSFLWDILDRLVIHPSHIEVRIRTEHLIRQLLGGRGQISKPEDGLEMLLAAQSIASINCPFRHVPQGRALRLIVGNTNITTDSSRQAIIKATARARRWYEQLTSGEAGGLADLASLHSVSERYVRAHFKLVQLSPQAIESLMTRKVSLPLSLDDLLTTLAMKWSEQTYGLASTPA